MDVSAINRYVNGMNTGASTTSGLAQAEQMKSKIGKISKDSTYEELEGAAKQFEAYMLEQTIKEFKKSIDEMKGEKEGDGSVSQLTDVYMDQTLSMIAESMVDSHAQRLTKDLADQMAHNMGIKTPEEEAKAQAAAQKGDGESQMSRQSGVVQEADGERVETTT